MARETGDLVGSLLRRVTRARTEAEKAVARSEVLAAARVAVREPRRMVKRCAWCGRLALGRGWVPADEVPAFVGTLLDERTTHGICEHCLRRLERDGASKPLRR
jgi:hypothetical protein